MQKNILFILFEQRRVLHHDLWSYRQWVIILGNELIILGNELIILGNKLIILGNELIILGNELIILLNELIILGNELIILGYELLLLLLKKIGNARLGEGDCHPISPKTPAPHYQPIEEKKRKGK